MTNSSRGVKRLKDKNQGISVIIAFFLLPLSGFATDIYIPSLPTMASVLHVSTIQVQLTLSFFMVSYGVSQLFIGSILDSFGRYRLVLAALLIFSLASLVIGATRSIYLIYAMRVVHGITMATIVVAKRAFFIDIFTGDKLKNYLTMFTIVWSAGPIIAPFIGGYFQAAFGWTSNFYFLALLTAVLAIPEFIFGGETLKHFAPFDLKRIAGVYGGMLRTTSFVLGLLMLGMAYCMVMVYNMTGPFIIEHHLHLSPVVAGYASLILGFAWMVGGLISKATLDRPFFKKLAVNLGFQAVFIFAMIASIGFVANLWSLIFFAFIIHVTAGYTFNNYFTYSLSQFPQHAGIASGLMGGITYLTISLLSYILVTFIPAKDEYNLSYSYLILMLCSTVVMAGIFAVNRKQARVARA